MVGKIRPKKVLLPMDFGNSKAKKEYTKPSIVFTYKKGEIPMYDLTFEDFLKTDDPYEAQRLFKQLVSNNSDSKIADYWGVSYAQVRKIRNELGLEKDKTGKVTSAKEPNKKFWDKLTRKYRPQLTIAQSTPQPEEETSVVETTPQPKEVPVTETVPQQQIDQETPTPEKEEPALEATSQTEKKDEMSFTIELSGKYSAEDLYDRLEGLQSVMAGCSKSKFNVQISITEVTE